MNVLVTGASGLFGSNAVFDGYLNLNPIGIYNQNHVTLKNRLCIPCDLTDTSTLEKIIQDHSIKAIIHAAANANIDHCETHPEISLIQNVEIPKNLAKIAHKRRLKFIHFSTDAFFDQDTPATEEDIPNPKSVYALHKWKSESEVLNNHPEAIVIRTNFYGWNARDKFSFSEWILNTENLTLFQDVFFQSLYVRTLSKIVYQLLFLNYSGILHVVSQDLISKYDFGLKILSKFNLSKKINPISIDNSHLLAPRSKKMCLSVKKLKSLIPNTSLSMEDGISSFFEDRLSYQSTLKNKAAH